MILRFPDGKEMTGNIRPQGKRLYRPGASAPPKHSPMKTPGKKDTPLVPDAYRRPLASGLERIPRGGQGEKKSRHASKSASHTKGQ